MVFPGTTQLQLEFSGGLNSLISEFKLDQPNLQAANNAVYNQHGEIDKRTGFKYISTTILGGGNISNGSAITTFNNELLVMDGEKIYTYDSDNQVWISRGPLFSTVNDQIRVINTKIATQSNPDVASLNGFELFCWEDSRPVPVHGRGIRYSIREENTGAWVVSDRIVYPLGFGQKVIGCPNLNQFNLYYKSSSEVLFLQTDRKRVV